MTTATREFTEACPGCGQDVKGKSVSGAKSRLRAHQRQLHSASEPDNAATTAKEAEAHSPAHTMAEQIDADYLAIGTEGSPISEAEGGTDLVSEITERLGAAVAEGVERENLGGPVPMEPLAAALEVAEAGLRIPSTRALDTKQLLDGLYGADKLGVLNWIHGKFQKPKNLFAAMHEVGLK